jgi:nitrite reductase (NADH) large subunit
LERVGMDYIKGKILEDDEGRKALYAALLAELKDAKDPWATSRESKAVKQFIPIVPVTVDA